MSGYSIQSQGLNPTSFVLKQIEIILILKRHILLIFTHFLSSTRMWTVKGAVKTISIEKLYHCHPHLETANAVVTLHILFLKWSYSKNDFLLFSVYIHSRHYNHNQDTEQFCHSKELPL